jgi:hypothetical protein
MTRHCHKCGWEWSLARQPGRSETCGRCEADLKVCLNCEYFDRSVAYQCRERRAEPVEEKDRANYCEWFELARRAYTPDPRADSRAEATRNQLKKLLGD